MTTKRNFYWDIRSIANSTIEEMNELDKQAKSLDDKIKSKRYTPDVISKELMPELQGIKREINKRKEEGCKAIRIRSDEYIAELRKADELNPDNLTDDIKLLQSGVALSADDLATLFDRNAGNSTMQKLITDFAKQHNRDIQRYYRPANADLIKGVENIPEVMRIVLKWHNKPDIFNNHVGEGSDLDKFLRDE